MLRVHKLLCRSPVGLTSVMITQCTLCHLSKSACSYVFRSHLRTTYCYCQSIWRIGYLYVTAISSGLYITCTNNNKRCLINGATLQHCIIERVRMSAGKFCRNFEMASHCFREFHPITTYSYGKEQYSCSTATMCQC
jgi:hypothetical protein